MSFYIHEISATCIAIIKVILMLENLYIICLLENEIESKTKIPVFSRGN